MTGTKNDPTQVWLGEPLSLIWGIYKSTSQSWEATAKGMSISQQPVSPHTCRTACLTPAELPASQGHELLTELWPWRLHGGFQLETFPVGIHSRNLREQCYPKGLNTPYIHIFSPTRHFIHASERTCDTGRLFHIVYPHIVWGFFTTMRSFMILRQTDKWKINHILYIHRAFAQHELTYFSERKYNNQYLPHW